MWGLLARFGGPIFAKECIEIARRQRYYLVRAVFATSILLALASVWNSAEAEAARPLPVTTIDPDNAVQNFNPRAPRIRKQSEGIRRQAAFANQMVQNLAWIQMFAIYLLLPLFLCGTIVEERKEGSFDLLFTTQLTDLEIIFGKFGSRAAVMLLLVLGAMPVISLTQLFGGVPWTLIAGIEWSAIVAVFFVGGISMFFAVACTSPFRAIMSTYVTLAGISTILIFASPLTALSAALNSNESVYSMIWILVFSVIPIAVAIVLTRLAILKLRDLPDLNINTRRWTAETTERDQPLSPDPVADESTNGLTAARQLWGPLRIAVDRNDPSIWQNLWVFGVIGVSLIGCIYVLSFLNPVGSHSISRFLLPVWAIVLAITVMVSVNNPLFTKRPGFFDLLLQTSLEPREILQGTVMVTFPVLLRLFIVPTMFTMFWCTANPIGLPIALVCGLLLGAMIIGLGNLCSLANYRWFQRIVPTITVPAAIIVAPMLIEGFAQRYQPTVWFLAFLGICLLGVVISGWMVRRTMSASAIGFHFLFMFWSVVGLCVGIPAILTKQPAFSFINPLTWFYYLLWEIDDRTRQNPNWIYLIGYLPALIFMVVWAWRFAIVHFDRLVGRETESPNNLAKQRRAQRVAQQTSAA